MPPQQPDRLLDLGDDGFDFRAHDDERFNGSRGRTQRGCVYLATATTPLGKIRFYSYCTRCA